ncbi:MAG: TolC family protein [Verrucomicrobiota bacterium]
MAYGLGLALLIFPAPGWAAEPKIIATSNDLLSLDWVTSQVLSNNPSLKAARANWEAMLQRVPQARAWEDLKVGVDVENAAGNTEWMAAQMFPISGKNRLRALAANAEASAAWTELEKRQLELVARARMAYYSLANAQVQLDINQKHEALLEQFIELSRNRYQLRAGMQADVLMAQTELAKNQETRRDLEKQFSDEQSKLNVLMNRPPGTKLPRPVMPEIRLIELELDELQAMALEHRPDLRMAQAGIEAAKARVSVARREWIPDPEIRFETRQFNPPNKGVVEYDAGIFINVPWLNRSKYRAKIAESQKDVERIEHDLAALQNETRGMVRDQWKKIDTAYHHHHIFNDRIVPLARQTLEALRVAYTTGETGILELINAQRMVREAESMLNHHAMDYWSSVADLEAMVGHRVEKPNGGKKP